MKLILLVAVLAPVVVPAALASQQNAAPAMPPGYEIPKNMTTYYLALYVRGPKFMANDSPEHQELTKRHLSYIRRMIEEKKYMMAGPLVDNGPHLGIAVISAPNAEEAKRIASGDPAIAAGHMAVEMRAAMLPSLSSLVVTY